MVAEPVPADSQASVPGKGSGGSPGRAGRDLPLAVAVGVGIGAVVLASVYTVRWTFVGVVMLAVGLALHELAAAVRFRGVSVPVAPLVAGGVLAQAVTWRVGLLGLVATGLLTAVAVGFVRLASGVRWWGRDALVGALLVLYVPVLAGCVVLLARPSDGADRVVAFAVATVCSDVGAYATGVLFGRHQLAATISPKKTWEGFAGSVGACALAGVVLLAQLFGAPAWQGLLFGLAVAFSATAGDLGESYLKRRLGIKDMGTLLPGHGGVMDRADSLLPTALVTLLLLEVFVPPS
jgi:phosphatidate cytidylyltransferase